MTIRPDPSRARSPEAGGPPLLRRRLSLDSPLRSSGEAIGPARGGLTAQDWQQLHDRVLPNPLGMVEFQRVVLEGRLHDHFLAKDLHKLVAELRVLLERHGELRMASGLAVKGTKTELSHAAAAALKLLASDRPRHTPNIPPSPPSPQMQQHVQHIQEEPEVPELPELPELPDVPELPELPELSDLPGEDVRAVAAVSSPFSRPLHIARRAPLRFGRTEMRFDVSPSHAAAVAARRLRVQLLPLRPPSTPARWPAGRDVAVYVNGQCVRCAWKRVWPARRVAVAAAPLPLDITAFLRRGAAQCVRVDVFARDFVGAVALCLVRPRAPAEVLAELAPPPVDPHDARDADAVALYRRVLEEDAAAGELEVADAVVAVKCPLLQSRMAVPMRGAGCAHLQCVDCLSFLLGCHRGCYWNCPICDAELRPADVRVDTLLWRFLRRAGDACPALLRLQRADGGFAWTAHTARGEDGHRDDRPETDGAAQRDATNADQTPPSGTAECPIEL